MMPKSDKCGKDRLILLILYGFGAVAMYCLFFFNDQILSGFFGQNRISGAIFSLIIIILAAGFYGNTVAIIIRCTLERSLECNGTRKG